MTLNQCINTIDNSQRFIIVENNKTIFDGNKYDLKESFSIDEYNRLLKRPCVVDIFLSDYFAFYI